MFLFASRSRLQIPNKEKQKKNIYVKKNKV